LPIDRLRQLYGERSSWCAISSAWGIVRSHDRRADCGERPAGGAGPCLPRHDGGRRARQDRARHRKAYAQALTEGAEAMRRIDAEYPGTTAVVCNNDVFAVSVIAERVPQALHSCSRGSVGHRLRRPRPCECARPSTHHDRRAVARHGRARRGGSAECRPAPAEDRSGSPRDEPRRAGLDGQPLSDPDVRLGKSRRSHSGKREVSTG